MDLVLIKDQHSNLKSEISYLVVPSLLMKCPQIKKKNNNNTNTSKSSSTE